MVISALSASATVTAGVCTALSIAHAASVFLAASELGQEGSTTRTPSAMPLHFSWSGAPRLFVGWKWIGVYPGLVLLEAGSLLLTLQDSNKKATKGANDRAKSRRWDTVTLMVALGATIVAQVYAGKIVLGEEKEMPLWLPKAIIVAVTSPALMSKIA